MENCYALLGIAPTATTDEIDEAYQRRKKEFEPDDPKLRELDSAYNEAIMATFAPIRAFSLPLPPLTIGKKSPQSPPPAPEQPRPQAPVQHTYVSAEDPLTTFKSTYTMPYTSVSVDKKVKDLVEEVPKSFTDSELVNMNVAELRESYMSHMHDEDDETGFLTLGIENRLARYYVKTYIVTVVFDIIMRLCIGPKWLMLTARPDQTAEPHTALFLFILFSFASVVYCFICALPMPFATRFFIMGQPPEKSGVLIALFFLGIAFAFLLRWLTGRFLPLNVVGSTGSFLIAAMALCLGTLRYANG